MLGEYRRDYKTVRDGSSTGFMSSCATTSTWRADNPLSFSPSNLERYLLRNIFLWVNGTGNIHDCGERGAGNAEEVSASGESWATDSGSRESIATRPFGGSTGQSYTLRFEIFPGRAMYVVLLLENGILWGPFIFTEGRTCVLRNRASK